MKELSKAYVPKDYETRTYEQWEKSGYFNPDNLPGERTEAYSIALPPPNATGILHLGHATMLAIQDLLIRFWRLRGRRTLWLPGTDHAAIATQNVVEKKLLQEEGKSRFDYGREEFVRRVNEFADGARSTIRAQIRSMGASVDWSRERYTLDDGLSRAVREVFVRMYQDGLIYRGKRIVNWCYRCGTTLADDEVEYKEQKSPFYYLKYGPIVIGTARPETKVLDKVIIVHPDDERYKKFIGRELDVPWIDGKIKARVVADKVAEMDKGSGAMTITPAHSFVDFELAQKYGFEVVQIIGPDGKLTSAAGKFAGLNVKAARVAIIAELQKKGLVVHIDENYINNLSVCYRCGTPIEPMPSEQWFVAVNKPFRLNLFKKTTLKKLAVTAVKSGRVNIVPARFIKVYEHWMNNLHDWCISRQIWFGHRIPAWKCNGCQTWQVTNQEPVRLIITRHGLTDWNKENRIQGRTDVPLDEQFVAQVEAEAVKLKHKHIDVIVSSPLMRARQTAEIFGKALHLPVVVAEDIQERDYGVFERRSVAEIKQTDPAYYANKLTYQIPGAETYAQEETRLKQWLTSITKLYAGKKVLVVSHITVLRTLQKIFENPDDQTLTNFRPVFGEYFEYDVVEPCPKCGCWGMQQDQDTLDTWFSSSLWTFSTLGWPAKTRDLATFHPTSVMETGYDILFFWVARMILMTSYILRDVPFRTVYLHGLVRDKQGRKMSKSLGNGIDPIEMIGKYGADSLRLSMIIGTTPGNDFRLYEEKIAGYRNFVNKLWNIVRFANLTTDLTVVDVPPPPKTLADKWILSRFATIADLVTKKIEIFAFSEAGEALYDFTWHELADWYLEAAKIEGNKQAILSYLITQLLKLWHPFTPFVTETLWRETFGDQAGLLMVAGWPAGLLGANKAAEQEFMLIQKIITAIRTFRTDHKIINTNVVLVKIIKDDRQIILAHRSLIEGLRTGAKIATEVKVYNEIKVGEIRIGLGLDK